MSLFSNLWGMSCRWRFALFLAGLLTPVSAMAQPFSIFLMPDPQYYTIQSSYNVYTRQAEWIRDYAASYNLKHVLWLGDLTNDNTPGQWTVANNAYTILDDANIPHTMIPGNHDYKTTLGWTGVNFRNLFYYNIICSPTRFNTKPWYGGNMGDTTTKNENNYTYFSAGGMDFLVVGLEFAPRKEAITWANNLISQHPNHRVIIFTHGYLGNTGVYIGQVGKSYSGLVGAAGDQLFKECVSRHSNVFLIACGHVTESVTNTKPGVNGNTVYEMLVDYQGEKLKRTGPTFGNGWLRVLQFDPANNRIFASTKTVAPGDSNIFEGGNTKFYLDRYSDSPAGADHLFNLTYDMTSPMEPYSYLVANTDFQNMSVNNDLTGNQLSPDIGQAANGNWATVWQDDDNSDNIYNVYVRGFDSDGNVRFQKSVVNMAGQDVTSATVPAMDMAPDGRFVVAWRSGLTEIKARTYHADGTPASNETVVVTPIHPAGTMDSPDVAMDSSGNFVVTWADDSDGNGSFQVRARGYAFDLGSRFDGKTINSIATGQQVNPAIAMRSNGDYVVCWEDSKDGTWDIGVRGFRANESQWFAQIAANTNLTGSQVTPDVAMNDNGNFVVVWGDNNNSSSYDIMARGFTPNATQQFAPMRVNVTDTDNQVNPAVDMDNSGNWYAVWEDNSFAGTGYQMVGNVLTTTGSRRNSTDSRLNTVNSVDNGFGPAVRKSPVVSAHKSGRYIVAWADDVDGNGKFQALAAGISGTARSLVVKSHYGIVSRNNNNAFYAPGESVTLTATANPGYVFSHWSGDVTSEENPVTVTMDASKNITAHYTATSHVDGWELFDASNGASGSGTGDVTAPPGKR